MAVTVGKDDPILAQDDGEDEEATLLLIDIALMPPPSMGMLFDQRGESVAPYPYDPDTGDGNPFRGIDGEYRDRQ
jgi:hypothetical protein